MGKHAASFLERQTIRLEKFENGNYNDAAKFASAGKLLILAAGALVLTNESFYTVLDAVQQENTTDNLLTAGGVILATAVGVNVLSYIENRLSPAVEPRHLGPNQV